MNRARALQILLTLPLSSGASAAAWVLLLAPRTAEAAERASLAGVVTHEQTKERIPNALILLQCSCLQGEMQAYTNENGLYAFTGLPSGTYTVQAFAGKANINKVIEIPRAAKLRANFLLDPNDAIVRDIVIRRLPTTAKVGTSVSMEDIRNIPIGQAPGRDWTQAAEVSSTVGHDARGLTIAGTTSAESNYTVDGVRVTSPSFGSVGASIVQDFLSEVEVQESGYDAEFGNAAGGQVNARRISGTNKVRGTARFSYTPRLAQPRFILATDNAVRAIEVPDYILQGAVTASGPIIKDRLFWSVGL